MATNDGGVTNTNDDDDVNNMNDDDNDNKTAVMTSSVHKPTNIIYHEHKPRRLRCQRQKNDDDVVNLKDDVFNTKNDDIINTDDENVTNIIQMTTIMTLQIIMASQTQTTSQI